MKICILYSGGLDSLVMLELAKEKYPDAEIIPVFFDIGQEYNWKEKAVLPKNTVVHDLSWFNATGYNKTEVNSGSIFIPGRNLLLVTLVATKYLPDEIWLGALLGETHDLATDKNFKFRDETTNLLKYVLSPFTDSIAVRFPLAEEGFNKLLATKWAVDKGLTDAVLESSSCMDGELHRCGKCVVCLRRYGILTQLGLSEEYTYHPVTEISESNRKMVIEMIAAEISGDDSHYDHHRRTEILPALELFFKTDLATVKLIMEDTK